MLSLSINFSISINTLRVLVKMLMWDKEVPYYGLI